MTGDDDWVTFYAEASAHGFDPDRTPDGRSTHFGKDGEPISFRTWAELMQREGYKRVDETTVGPYWVSTVWLGIDHSFGMGRPLIFETMVFDLRNEGLVDEFMERYATIQQAEQGHMHIVEMVRQLEDASSDEVVEPGANGQSDAEDPEG